MDWRIDTSGVTLLAAGEAEQMTDFETGAPRVDKDGQPLYVMRLIGMASGRAEVIAVRLAAAAPKGVGEGVQVRVHDLTATPWTSRDGTRSGVSFKATKVEALTPARSAG